MPLAGCSDPENEINEFVTCLIKKDKNMGKCKVGNNPYKDVIIDESECVIFQTVGKEVHDVIVDKRTWYGYLKQYSWTAIRNGSRINVKTSIDKQSNHLWRVIVEHEYEELDWWGATVDHINNNPLDNRICNLRLYNAAILNSTNVSSKYGQRGMQYIHKNGNKNNPSGFKIHYNLAGKTFYRNFGVSEYGSIEKALEAAQKYRDETVTIERENVINEMLKKTRSIEFRRGLKGMLRAGERDEVLAILKDYGLFD